MSLVQICIGGCFCTPLYIIWAIEIFEPPYLLVYSPCRIPPTWFETIHTFYDDYRCAAPLLQPHDSVANDTAVLIKWKFSEVLVEVGIPHETCWLS